MKDIGHLFLGLRRGVDLSGPMTKIQASAGAFAAIAADGHVVAWGAQDRGGLVAPDVCLGVTSDGCLTHGGGLGDANNFCKCYFECTMGS